MAFMERSKLKRLSASAFSVPIKSANLHAHIHLCSLVGMQARGVAGWEKGKLNKRPRIIYDLSGLPLFYDFTVRRGRFFSGVIRVAAHKSIGDSVISTHVTPLGWDMRVAQDRLKRIIRKKYPRYALQRTRLVCYSYPKLALRADIVSPGREPEMLLMDVGDFSEIPIKPVEKIDRSGLVAYSFLDKISEDRVNKGSEIWGRINRDVEDLINREKKLKPSRMAKISARERLAVIDTTMLQAELVKLYTEDILDFCCHAGDCHDHECFCLHPQENGVHCTRASSQMVLCYWRYCYSQHDIAQAFGVDDTDLTPWNSVAPGLNALTHDCFDATLDYSVNWSDCRNEIQNRRPFLSDDGGHTRACAGTKEYWIWIAGQPRSRYLYIFDPWPANTGAIYWENFNTASYAWIGKLVRKTTNHT